MSVTNTSSKTIFLGTGSVATYAFLWNIWTATDLVLTKIDTLGVETILALTTDYTVSLSHAAPTPGTITLVAGNLPTGYQLVIQRVLPLTQQINISDYSPTPAATWNEGYDRAVMLIQQLQEQLSRAVLQAVNATVSFLLPAPAANKIIGWNAGATALENKDLLPGPTGPTGPAGANGADGIFTAIASQAEAEAGTDNTKGMTPLRAAQEIAAKVVKATGAEITTGTNDTKFATPKALADAGVGPQSFYAGSFSRDTSLDTDLAITGIGFKPRYVLFYAGLASTTNMSNGFDDGTHHYCTWVGGLVKAENAVGSMILSADGTNNRYGYIKTLDADGFTMGWSKDASPTGMANIRYVAFK